MDFSQLVIDYENVHDNTQKLNTYNLLYRYGIIIPELHKYNTDLTITSYFIDQSILSLLKTRMDKETHINLIQVYKNLIDELLRNSDKLSMIIYSKEVSELLSVADEKMGIISDIRARLINLRNKALKYDGVWSMHIQEDENYLLSPPSMKGDYRVILTYIERCDKLIRIKLKNFSNDRMMDKFIKKIDECLCTY